MYFPSVNNLFYALYIFLLPVSSQFQFPCHFKASLYCIDINHYRLSKLHLVFQSISLSVDLHLM